MKIIYIAHPISGDVQANLKDLRRIIRNLNLTEPDIVPCAPYYADVVSLNENSPAQRARGIANDHALIKTGIFSELWLTGSYLSPGMRAEELLFMSLNIPVKNYIGKI